MKPTVVTARLRLCFWSVSSYFLGFAGAVSCYCFADPYLLLILPLFITRYMFLKPIQCDAWIGDWEMKIVSWWLNIRILVHSLVYFPFLYEFPLFHVLLKCCIFILGFEHDFVEVIWLWTCQTLYRMCWVNQCLHLTLHHVI